MRLRLLIAAVALLALLVPTQGGAASLSSRIQEKQNAIEGKRSTEQVLTTDIRGLSDQIGSLQSDISGLESREAALQSDLDAKLARLAGIQDDLRAERVNLARLRAKLETGKETLSKRLVDLYKADNPDVLTVALSSHGFADLLESTEFARRIGRQDNRILTAVTSAKAESAEASKRLAGLESDSKEIATAIQVRRDEVAQVKGALVSRRDDYSAARQKKTTVLSGVRDDREHLEGNLKDLQAQEAEIQRKLAGVPSGAGPVRTGSGGLIWPVNGPIVSPFGQRWGQLHAGVDIAVASGTPVRAAASGSVAIAGGVGGYGNYVCIQHAGALSTCYAHNTSLAVNVGQSVTQGQVIASSGCTGHCLGPHVHFETRINGTPVDPLGYL